MASRMAYHRIWIHALDEFDEQILVQFAEEDSLLLQIIDHLEQQSLVLERQVPEQDGQVRPMGFTDDFAEPAAGAPTQQPFDTDGQNFLSILLH